jgi:4-methyl-5(b-hydroxyethyl)-thiazole monophosphate biosynthesis
LNHIITILADGFEEVEAITVIDLLRRAEIRVTTLGLSSTRVRGAHNIEIIADQELDRFSDDFDGIVLPGGQPGTRNLAASEKVLSLVRSAYKQDKLCAAICAAPLVLARAGILTNRKATCFPGVEKSLDDAQFLLKPVVRDGTIITSRGVATALQFALELISYFKGPQFAETIGRLVLFKE